MKNIAYWSKRNPIKARWIIALCHLVLICIGISMGVNAYFNNIRIPYSLLVLMMCVFSAAYVFYPVRGQKKGLFRYSFDRRVRHDFILALSSTWVLLAGVNHFAFQPIQHHQPEPQVLKMVNKTASGSSANIKKEITKSLFAQIKNYRTELKQQLKSMKAQKQTEGEDRQGLKALLILLTILVALGLLLVVATLSCNLSCAGNEGLAGLVLVGGTLFIVLGVIFVIANIVKKGKKQPALQPGN